MFLQGNLQNVFDALYQLGIIDPVLKMDWKEAMKAKSSYEWDFKNAVLLANAYQSSTEELATHLTTVNRKGLEFLAMEVAREFADYQSRTELH
jgi:hypothetical protein